MSKYIFSIIMLFLCNTMFAQKQDTTILTMVDNIGYWISLVKQGVIKPGLVKKAPPAVKKGTDINSPLIALTNSPDVLINNSGPDVSQSENSIFINPFNKLKSLNSNVAINITNNVSPGTVAFTSVDQGATWQGDVDEAGTEESEDVSTAIALNGKYYIGYQHPTLSYALAVSADEGTTWTRRVIHDGSVIDFFSDKPHLSVDKSITSPYQNNLYAAWMNIGGSSYNWHVGFTRSTDDGATWSTMAGISGPNTTTNVHQGVNLHCGPNGEVYATWAIYNTDLYTPSDEAAIGFTSSSDGGVTFTSPVTIASNLKGVRLTGVGKNMRVNSYPTMAVDNSFGPHRGSIYVVWTNIGEPGTNSGSDADIYMVKSVDGGITWSSPSKVNSSVTGQGKKHYFPWITCDQTTGKLHIVYYDDRSLTGSSDCETWMSSSFDGGATWDDYKVSDVSFTPTPIIPVQNFFGDYLNATSDDDVIYPVWTDNRSGLALAYTSPLISNDFCPVNLSLQNINQPLVATYKYRAQNAITTAGTDVGGSLTSFIMQGNGTTGARCSMIAGNSITLLPNTSIEKGAVLTIVPGVCSSPILRTPDFSNSNDFTKLKIQAKEFEINSKVNLYPNPVNNVIYLELSDLIKNNNNLSYIITDLLARPILKGKINNKLQEINTNNLTSGGYFLSVYENEKLIETKTFVKK